jgi:hypothetical protein
LSAVDATPGQQWKLLERRPLKGIDEAVALFALDR